MRCQIYSCVKQSNIKANPNDDTSKPPQKSERCFCAGSAVQSVFLLCTFVPFRSNKDYYAGGICIQHVYALTCSLAAGRFLADHAVDPSNLPSEFWPEGMVSFEQRSESIIMKPRVKHPGWINSVAPQAHGPIAHNSPVMNKHPPSIDIWWGFCIHTMIQDLICICVMLFQDYIKLLKYHALLWPWSCLLFIKLFMLRSGSGPVELITVELGWMLATNEDHLPTSSPAACWMKYKEELKEGLSITAFINIAAAQQFTPTGKTGCIVSLFFAVWGCFQKKQNSCWWHMVVFSQCQSHVIKVSCNKKFCCNVVESVWLTQCSTCWIPRGALALGPEICMSDESTCWTSSIFYLFVLRLIHFDPSNIFIAQRNRCRRKSWANFIYVITSTRGLALAFTSVVPLLI